MKSILLLIICLSIFNSELNAQTTTSVFFQLKSIEGSWVIKSDSSMLIETWAFVNDSLLEGFSQLTDLNNAVLFSEKLEIRITEKSIVYIAAISGQNDNKEVPFELKSSNNSVFIFENLAHDFPQRIIYDLSVKDKISAHIEGDVKGQIKRTDFNFVRAD